MAVHAIRKLAAGLALGMAVICSPALRAAEILLDFESVDKVVGGTANLAISGVRISPSGHFDIQDASDTYGAGWGSRWLGFDCGIMDVRNPDFLGPAALLNACGYLWMDMSGSSFSLLSFDVVRFEWSVTSSKGGVFAPSFTDVGGNVVLAGDEWRGIEWLLFRSEHGLPAGFDNMAFGVPEPGLFGLLGLGLAALAVARGRRSD